MAVEINDWEFTAGAANWINEDLARYPRLLFSRAKCEQRGFGVTKRLDLTLLDETPVVSLTGKIKLSFQKDAGSPNIETVVQDAWQKAPNPDALDDSSTSLSCGRPSRPGPPPKAANTNSGR